MSSARDSRGPRPPARTRGADRVTGFIASADLAALLYLHVTANTPAQLPNGLFHAIAAGLPVFYPLAMPVRRLCEERGLGVAVDPSAPESLSGAVRALLDDPGRLARLRAGVNEASRELSWEHEEPTLASLVAGALAGAPPDARTARAPRLTLEPRAAGSRMPNRASGPPAGASSSRPVPGRRSQAPA